MTPSLATATKHIALAGNPNTAEKIRAVQAAMAAEPPPAHVPRERKPVEKIDNGPLVLVETRKDLSQVKLPFEQQAPGA